MSLTLGLKDVYILSSSSVTGPEEQKGPLKNYFDFSFSNIYADEKTYENGELAMSKMAIDLALKKARLKMDEINVALGGDLLDQLAVSNFAMMDYPFPFIGVYGACSTAILSLALASTLVNAKYVSRAMSFTSSNYGSAERQFRYPTEYGVVKKDTMTITVSGASAFIIGNTKTKVRIRAITFGESKNSLVNNVNDMGSPMALAAYYTIKDHLKNTGNKFKNYDAIFTGDLSEIGSKVLERLFLEDRTPIFNHVDCGNLIYDNRYQKVYSGASGCGCVALTTASYIIKQLCDGVFNRVLIVGTGALHSPTFVAQKKNIPVIAHAVELERVNL